MAEEDFEVGSAARSRWELVALPAAAGLFVYLLTFLLPATPILNESDHHMFLYEGMRLAGGDVMYRDFFQFTFPGSQAWYWGMFAVFGLRYWILPATIIAIAAGSTFACLLVSRQLLTGAARMLPAAIFVFFGFRWDGLDGTHRMFSPVFIILAVAVLLSKMNRKAVAIAGMLCAAASFFTQQRGLAAMAAIAIFLIAEQRLAGRRLKGTFKTLAILAVSFAAVLFALCGYFVLTAGFGTFVDSTIIYPVKYYSYAPYNEFSILFTDVSGSLKADSMSSLITSAVSILYLFILPITYLVFWAVFIKSRKNFGWNYWRGITLVASVGTAMTLMTTAPNTSRMFQIALPGLIVLTWLAFHFASAYRFRHLGKMTAAFAAGTVLIGLSQVIRVQTTDFAHISTPSGQLAYKSAPIIDGRYRFLLERTRPGDAVFEAYQPYIYFPLHLRNPSRYGQIWPSDYTRPEHVSETIEDLRASRPRFILWNNDYNSARRVAGDHIGPLAEFVQSGYRPVGAVIEIPEGRIQVWESSEDASAVQR